MKKLLRTKLPLIIAGASIAAATTAHADGFDLSEKLAVTGFIDMSTSYTDPENTPSTSSTGLDQFEMDFLYTFDEKISAQVDLEYQDDGNTDSAGDALGEVVDIEQAFVNYAITDELSFKAGRFLSYSGWETEDPTGLFQYSGTGYAKYFYGGYQQGMSTKYSNSMFDVGLSIVNSLGDLQGRERDSSHPGVETMLAFHPVDSWVIKAFYLTDKEPVAGKTIKMVNLWTSYSVAGFTFAVEGNNAKNTAGVDTDATGYLAMANYAYGKFGITLRYHAWEVEDVTNTVTEDMSGITLSPSYAVSDNLLLVAEIRSDDDSIADTTTDSYALEALITW